MMKKRYSSEQIIRALKENEAGGKVEDICRRLGISAGTFYNWLGSTHEGSYERTCYCVPALWVFNASWVSKK